jgi:predicted DNA-binding transcriptional regulator AlpA
MDLLTKEEVAKMLNTSVAQITNYTYNTKSKIPKYLAKGGIVMINGVSHNLPEKFKTKTRNKVVYVKSEVVKWLNG